MIDEINYTILSSKRLKVFQVGKYPLFPNEAVDMLRFSIKIPIDIISRFITNATIDLTLMFGNKTDKLSFSVKEHLEKK